MNVVLQPILAQYKGVTGACYHVHCYTYAVCPQMKQPVIVDSHLIPMAGAHVWPQVPVGHLSAEGTDETEVLVTYRLEWLSIGRALQAWESKPWPWKGLWAELLLTCDSESDTMWVRPKC